MNDILTSDSWVYSGLFECFKHATFQDAMASCIIKSGYDIQMEGWGMLDYLELTRDDIAKLDRANTLFVSVVAPIEVHGGHLPTGTDLFIADAILKRTVERLEGWAVVRLPDLLIGAQAIPAPGSIRIKGSVLATTLKFWGEGLAALGFRYWMVFDNHGGATHQIAEAAAARKLKRRGLNLLVPFIPILRGMVNGSMGIGLPPGHDGGTEDAHAGTNETSLMLALSPGRVRESYQKLPRWKPTKGTPMGAFGRLLGQPFLGMAMDWFAAPDNPHYVGCPAEATAEAGETMAEYHIQIGLSLLKQAREGTYLPPKPFPGVVTTIIKMFE
jgi:creatinine amidohydrolase